MFHYSLMIFFKLRLTYTAENWKQVSGKTKAHYNSFHVLSHLLKLHKSKDKQHRFNAHQQKKIEMEILAKFVLEEKTELKKSVH